MGADVGSGVGADVGAGVGAGAGTYMSFTVTKIVTIAQVMIATRPKIVLACIVRIVLNNIMIPTALKTGFAASNNDGEMSAIQTRLLALLALMIENSISNAIVYSTHAGIDEVDDVLMERALKVEALQFFDRDSLEEDVLELEKEILEMSDEDDDDEDEEDEEMSDDDGTMPPADLDADGVCRCDLCKRFETVDTDWKAWDVTDDPVKAFLKTHINDL